MPWETLSSLMTINETFEAVTIEEIKRQARS